MGLFSSLVKNTFLKRHKRLLILLSAIFAILIAFNYYFEKYTSEIVGPLLKELIQKKSNGLYRADFKKMGLALNTGLFYVNDFSVAIDSAAFMANQAGPNPVNMIVFSKIPRLYIQVTELWTIYIKQELHVTGIESVHPKISILKLRSDKKDTTKLKKEIDITDLYALISDYLTVFELNNFTVKEGGFRFSSAREAGYNNYEINNISIEVKNFLLDEHASTDKTKFFYTDNVSVEIKNQSFSLPDSLHEISFDRLLISTLTKSVEIDNLIVEELPRIDKDPVINPNLNRMYFVIPSLRIYGIDFVKAYNQQSIYMDKFLLESPIIKFVSAPVTKNKKRKAEAVKGHRLLPEIINNVVVDTLTIDNAKFDITMRNLQTSSHAAVEQLSLTINNFRIDTTDSPGHLSEITYENLALSLKNSKYNFPDQLHNLEIASVKADSNPLNIEFTGLNFKAFHEIPKISEKNESKRDANTAMDLFFPQIAITNFSLSAFLNQGSLSLSDIRFSRPDIYRCTKEKVKTVKSEPLDLKKLSNPYSFVKKALQSVKIDNILIDGGIVNILKCNNKNRGSLSAEDLNIHISAINLDSTTSGNDGLPGAEKIFLGLSSLKYALPGNERQLQLMDIEFNSSDGIFLSSAFNLFSVNPESGKIKSRPDAQIGNVKLTGIDLQQFFKTGMAFLDTLSIGSVRLDLALNNDDKEKKRTTVNSEKDAGILKELHLRKFLITSGGANFNQDGETIFQTSNFNFGLENIAYIPGRTGKRNINIEGLDLNLDKYSIFLKKINHQLTGDHIGLSSGSKNVIITNLQLSPLKKAESGNVYEIDIPAIKITGINVARIFFDSTFTCSSILISDPKIQLEFKDGNGKQKKTSEIKNKKEALPHPMKLIQAGEIKLVNGYFKFHKTDRDTSRIIEVQNVNFTLNDVDVDSSGILSREKLLYARSIDVFADYITSYQPERQKFTSLNHLNFSSNNHLLKGSGLYLSTNTGEVTKERSRFKIDLDEFIITGLDILTIANDHYLEIEDISLTRPRIVLEQIKKERTPQNVKKNNKKFVYPLDSMLIGHVKINAISINDGKANMTTTDVTETNSQLYAGGINLLVGDLYLTPKKHQSISTKSFAKTFQLNIGNLLYDLPDNLNRIKVGEVSLNSTDTTLVVYDFELVPKLEKYEYGPAKGFQTDWVHMTNKKLTVNNLQVNNLLFENKLIAPSIALDGMKIFLFRDKRVPFKNVYKPLPQEQLHKMGLGLKLDSVIISDANVVYQEFAEKSTVPGEIYITDLNGRLLNVTNDSVVLAEQPKMFLEATGAFAGNGAINLQVVFDMLDTNRVFHLGAIISDLDLREFNRMLSPTVFVQIKSGYDKNLIMTSKANNDYAYGEMRFYYDDLKIAVLNKKTETPKGIGNALASFFANSFFINSNNPRLLSLRKGEVFFERNKYKSIFNYWIKTFLSGVVTSIGAKSNKKQIEKIQAAQRKKYDLLTTPGQ